MQTLTGEVGIVLGITIMLTTITFFIVFFIIISQNHYHKYLREKVEMKNIFNQELLKAQLEIKEQTIHHISQEIHDNIGQILSLVKLNLSTVPLDPFSSKKIQHSRELVGKAINDLRDLSKTLNTDYISQLKLSESIQLEVDSIRKTGFYNVSFELNGMEKSTGAQLIIFRIAQEILNNIIKHAKATQIKINLDFIDENFKMMISDNGIGFETNSIEHSGIGLTNMYYRTKLIGGEFIIDSKAGLGTSITLKLPLKQPTL